MKSKKQQENQQIRKGKLLVKKITTIEDLAIMVARGFESITKVMVTKTDLIEVVANLDHRISALEVKSRSRRA